MDGFNFATEIRVRFAETDAQGVAHNSNYFVWFEVARIDYLERYAGGYQRLRDAGIESLVLESHVRFLVAGASSTTGCSSTRAASTCAARASASSTRRRATARRSPTAGRRTGRSTRRRSGRRGSRAWLVEAIATAEAPVPSA